MKEWLIPTLIGLGLPAIIGAALWAFGKYLPKQATFDKFFSPVAEKCAVVVDLFLGRWLKPVDEDKLEEGFFKTVAFWLDGWIHVFMAKLGELIDARLKKTGILLLVVIGLLLFVPSANAGLLSPEPARANDSTVIIIQMDIPVGMIGLTKSATPGRQLDARILNCVGFGPSLQWQQWTGKNYTTFAVTAAALFFPRMDGDAFPWDVGAGLFVTAFGGYGLGIGYNAGAVPGKTINRVLGLLVADVMPWRNR
jgi:hypothetical protein